MEEGRPDANFAGFIPTSLARILEERGGLPETATEQALHGAVLFVDIVDFTRMTDRLADQGRRGTEVVSEILNRALGPLVEEILSTGGDLVVFAGDAIIAMWPFADPGERAAAVRAACWSAQAVRERSSSTTEQGHPPEERDVTGRHGARIDVRMRAAVGVGRLSCMELGGHQGRWRFLVKGPGVVDAVRADARAGPEQVVLSPRARAVGRATCRGVEIGDGFLELASVPGPPPRRRSHPVDAQVARRWAPAFVPRVVVDRVRAGHGAWLAEFRRVSVLFLGLATEDSAGVLSLETLQEATVATQRVLGEYDGTLYATLFDDKGHVLIGLFGLPHQAHEQDPERAVLTALELHDSLRRAGVDPSIGIATGVAYSGLYGAGGRQQYMVVGSVMNLAARLMRDRTGGVLCDHATARALDDSSRVALRPLGVIRVKGKPDPVRAFAPERSDAPARAQDRARSLSIFGRDEELAALAELLPGRGEGEAGVLALVGGEAGTGKSALAGRLLEIARMRGLRTAVGRASEIERNTPYFALRGALQDLLGSPFSRGGDVEDRLRSLGIRSRLLRRAPLLGPILRMGIPDNESTSELRGDRRSVATRRLVVDLVAARADRPVVIWLDDVHHMDSASWQIVEELCQALPHLLVVATHRTPAEELPLEEWPPATSIVRTELGGLSVSAQRSLVERLLDATRVDDTLMSWIARESRGVPLFVEQLTLALRESGSISVQGERAGFSDEAGLGLEAGASGSATVPSLESVITRRVDVLPDGAQLTLKVLSVVGRAIEEDVVARIHPTGPSGSELATHLTELASRGFVQRAAEDGRVKIPDASVRDAVYATVPFALRTELHEDIARWLETELKHGGSAEHAALAHHWLGAERPERALPHLDAAGHDALGLHANVEAVRLFSRAVEVAENAVDGEEPVPADTLGSWRIGMGRAYVQLQHYAEGVRELDGGLRLMGERLPDGLPGLGLATGAALVRHLAWRVTPRAPRPGDGRREELLRRSRAYESLMEASYVSGDRARSFVSALRALNRAEAAGPSPELARGYATVGSMLGFIPLHRPARSYGRRALALAERVGHPATSAWVKLALGVYYLGVADWARAGQLLERASTSALESGDHRRWVDCEAQVAQLLLMRGDLRGALDRVESALERAAHEHAPGTDFVPRHADQFFRVLAHARFALGDAGAAAEAGRRYRDAMVSRSVTDHLNRATMAVVDLAVHSAEAGPPGSGSSFEEIDAVMQLPFAPIPSLSLEFELVAQSLSPGMVEATAGEGRTRFLRSVRRHARVFPVSRPAAAILRALLDPRPSRGTKAELLRRAAERAKEIDRPFVEATALYHLGLWTTEASERSRSLLECAHLCERLGARLLLRRVRQELAS